MKCCSPTVYARSIAKQDVTQIGEWEWVVGVFPSLIIHSRTKKQLPIGRVARPCPGTYARQRLLATNRGGDWRR